MSSQWHKRPTDPRRLEVKITHQRVSIEENCKGKPGKPDSSALLGMGRRIQSKCPNQEICIFFKQWFEHGKGLSTKRFT